MKALILLCRLFTIHIANQVSPDEPPVPWKAAILGMTPAACKHPTSLARAWGRPDITALDPGVATTRVDSYLF
jgi:hypothetical protein